MRKEAPKLPNEWWPCIWAEEEAEEAEACRELAQGVEKVAESEDCKGEFVYCNY